LEIRNTIVIADGAGTTEVNGTYTFVGIKFNAGYYHRIGEFKGEEARFTMYKCSLKNGGFQWFLSITPAGMEPGTTNDIDFYFAPGKAADVKPPTVWARIAHTTVPVKDPAPKVTLLRDGEVDDSDSDDQGSLVVGDDSGMDIEDSFNDASLDEA
jgi:hypothetical protein